MHKFAGLFFVVFFAIGQPVSAQLPDFTSMAKEGGKAVVNISTTQKNSDPEEESDGADVPQDVPPQLEEFFKHFFQGPGGEEGGPGLVPRETESLGSGFIISKDGYVLTNHHVVKNADEIVVKLSDRRELLAKLIGSDESADVALLKVETKDDLPVVEIGSSKKLQVGEWVLAIGSPFGFEQSVTSGIVSAKGRSLPGGNYVPFIQTDVAINPGNSGGPLFNMAGQVVGMNSQIYSESGGYMGLSFAIPMDLAMNVVDQLKTNGKVARGWLGVQIQDVTRELAESFGMDRPHGALVAKVITDSPAEKAGIQIGDIIVAYNGNEIDTSGELPPLVGITPIEESAQVKIIRQGDSKTLNVKVGLLPVTDHMMSEEVDVMDIDRLGIVVSDLSPEQRRQLEVEEHGVLVQEVKKGPAMDAGILRGDVIIRIQNQLIRDSDHLARVTSRLPSDKSLAVLIQRRGSPTFLAIKLPN